MTPCSETDESRELLDSLLVWDNHSCMPLRPDDTTFLPQLERVRASGVDAVTLNIGMDLTSAESHYDMLDSFEAWVADNSEGYTTIESIADVCQARSDDRLAIAFDIEGMGLFDDGDLSRIGSLRRRGVLWMLVAYNRNNRAGGGCLDEDTGLTDHGRAILDQMRRVGMVACCSHSGHRTALDVMSEAGNPVIFSHSNADAVYPHVRNVPDALIRACAETGGVVGINGVGDFLGAGEDYADLLVRHIDHAVALVGPAHVGVALDYVFDKQEVYDFIEKAKESFGEAMAAQFSARFAPPESFLPVTAKLLHMGYTKEDLAGILGGNWLRVFTAVEDAADSS